MPPTFCVSGAHALEGTIRPAGNKNAALPILAATLLAEGPCRIENVPHIRDVETMLALLEHLGASVTWTGPNAVEVDTRNAQPRDLDPALCARVRASILFAGPMVARFGRVALPPPGGDVIGRRRVDTHFLALEALGADVEVGKRYQLEAKALTAADVFLDEPSVTGTENALMADLTPFFSHSKRSAPTWKSGSAISSLRRRSPRRTSFSTSRAPPPPRTPSWRPSARTATWCCATPPASLTCRIWPGS